MEAVDFINSLTTSLVKLVAAGGVFTAGVYAIKMTTSEDESDIATARRNIKRVIIGVILGSSVIGLIKTIFSIIK